jgi:ABC-type uncharacterized transport system permease subunit
VIRFQQIAAALYLAAGVGALLGIALPDNRIRRGAVWGLAFGFFVQTLSFVSLHRMEEAPALTSLPMALSFMVWMAVVSLLLLMRRMRLTSLVAAVGPLAFLAVFASSLMVQGPAEGALEAEGSLPHLHILLSSAGLSLLGIAGLAGGFFLLEHRRIKSKRPFAKGLRLPSLEALNRVNTVSLAIGFLLLTLGFVSGVLWLNNVRGTPWEGSGHQVWTLVAWIIYAGLVGVRFAGNQAARPAAASALAGFAFLLFAVIGVGLLT